MQYMTLRMMTLYSRYRCVVVSAVGICKFCDILSLVLGEIVIYLIGRLVIFGCDISYKFVFCILLLYILFIVYLDCVLCIVCIFFVY